MTGNTRRLIALAAAVLLLAAAVVTAVILSGRPDGAAPPSASVTVTTTAAAAPTQSATPAPPSSPATSPAPAPPSSPPLTEAPVTEAPLPPAEPPPAPPPPPPAPPQPPADPFPAALRGADVGVIPNAGPVVALTFDAGANSAGLPGILQTLAATGTRATFFLTGTWASANQGGVASIVAAGHRVGNHSMTHPGFTSLSDAQIAQQLAGAEAAITAAGADPRPLFRFPFGERDTRTIAAVNALGYLPVRWTVDTLGWKGTSGGITAQIVADRVLAGLQPGEIVLMHIGSNPDDGSTLDADALPQLINRIRQAGYGFTTLDALLG
ncbi:polysaccharide deacetylase family protein [Arthrobacter sp. KBS0702]|uniref:polysaccharide deacetylase family protein n=1 Tax=Arthrobacter sp. KBS0702 TaxID=2578107 RepID=UPI0021BD6A1B|nr:polysaccharide deacetylase family protein [Arthrobacter sp. KBS0702]